MVPAGRSLVAVYMPGVWVHVLCVCVCVCIVLKYDHVRMARPYIVYRHGRIISVVIHRTLPIGK